MDEVTLIETVQSYLDTNLSVPVRTKGGTEDDRAVPIVVLDAFDITDITFHNTHLAAVNEKDSAGTPDERFFRFHYWARFDYLARHTDDRNATLLLRDVRNLFRPLTEHPEALDSDLNEVELRGGGGFSLSNVEDSESEVGLAIRIRTFHQMTNTDDPAFSTSTLDTIQNKMDAGYGPDFNVTN